MAIEFTAIPGPLKATSKGVSLTIAAGDDLSADDYRLLIDVPCHITVDPLPTPVNGDSYEIEGE